MGRLYDLCFGIYFCICGVQENVAIGLVVLRDSRVNAMFCNTFLMREH